MNVRSIVAAALFAASSAFAQAPSVESIDALLTVTKSERLLDTLYANLDTTMRQMVAQTTQGQTLTPRQRRAMDALPGAMAQAVREEFSWAQLRPLYVTIYQESLTQEEVDGLLAFYRSPAGAAMVNKMPVVAQKTMAVMQDRIGPLVQKMQAAVERAMKDADTGAGPAL